MQIKKDCYAYNQKKNDCNVLKELYCRKEECSFYKSNKELNRREDKYMNVIPKKIIKNGRKYELLNIYNTYALYQDIKAKYKICFTKHELGLIKDYSHIMQGFKKNPQKVTYL